MLMSSTKNSDQSSGIPFKSDLRSDTVQDFSVRMRVFIKFTHAPFHCCPVRFALHCTSPARSLSLLSLPEASHWLLKPLLKIRLVEISTFCGGGLGRNTESSNCIQSPQQVVERKREGGSLCLSFSVSEREREGV
ncbi:hypothetical protein PAMP_024406 [Pampus punctatissimus]